MPNSRNIHDLLEEELLKRKALEEQLRLKDLEISSLTQTLWEKNSDINPLLDKLKEIVFQLNVQGSWIFLNRAWTEITGYTSRETLGNKFNEFLFAEDRDVVTNEIDNCIAEHTNDCRVTWRISTKQGELKWMECFMHFTYTPDNKYRGATGTIIDVTERHIMEARLREQKGFYEAIIDNIPLDVVVLDLKQRYLLINPYASRSEAVRKWIIGRDDFEYCVKFSKDRSLAANRRKLFNTVKQDKAMKEWEEAFDLPDGTVVHRMRRMHPVTDEKDNLKYVIGYGMDITERKLAEESMKTAKEAAEASVKAKEIFISNFSHEVRTPLNGIIGISELLNKTELTDEQKKYMSAIKDSADNLLIIINDILDLSRIDSGKLEMEYVPLDVIEVINKVISSYLYKASGKDVNLRMKPLPATAIAIYSDPVRLYQIFSNLINNAIKFTPHGYIEIGIDIIDQAEQDITCRYTVKDTGIGIPSEKLPYIFDRFSQADPSITRKYGGTGLGLSITRNLIELQGGQLDVSSLPGKGTTFSFSIKHNRAKLIDVKRKQENEEEDLSLPQHLRILVAEDNEINRLVLKNIFKSWNVTIEMVVNGKEAVATLCKKDFDLILMDIQMPVMSGLEATIEIRKLKDPVKANIPIIALTANAMKGEYEKYLAAGMNDYLSKPFRQNELVSKIRGLVTKQNMEAEIATEAQIHRNNEPIVPIHMNNKQELYDLRSLKDQMLGDMEIIKSVVELFIQTIPEELERLKNAVDARDMNEVSKIAHKLKSNILMLNIAPLKENVRQLEKAHELEEAEVGRLSSVFISTIRQTTEALQEELNAGKFE